MWSKQIDNSEGKLSHLKDDKNNNPIAPKYIGDKTSTIICS